MTRRTSFAVLLAAIAVMASAVAAAASPVKLARHPDYNAGRITFSYLGDIWIANEDGTAVRRLTVNRAREIYPRFSPDGRMIAFSSNRYGNNDVFVVPVEGGAPNRLTFHTGADEVVGWSRDSKSVIFRAARGVGAFPNVATLHTIAVAGGQEQPLPVDWGFSGSLSPDGRSLVFNRHPSTWSRRHYRGSYAADLWVANIADKTYTPLLGDERYNRYWPMWGADDAIYFVADPLPNEKNVKPGSPEVRNSVNNIYRLPVKGGQPVQVTSTPTAACSGRRCRATQGHRLRSRLRHLEAGRRERPGQRDQDRHHHRRERERRTGRDGERRGSTTRHLAVGGARRFPRAARS